jgi:hypothetical protein
VGVWAGDDSPSKRDRQPLFLPMRCSQCARLLLLERGNKKSVAPDTLTPARAACVFSRPLSSSFTKPKQGDSLLHELDYYNCFTSVYLPANFVNLQFVTSLDFCWDEMAMGWHPDADIRHSFAMNFKKMSLAVGQHTQ